jgi:hypothetical protein
MATGNAIQSAQAPGTGGGTGTVTSVTATDTSIVVSGTATVNPTIATGTLDVIAADHPPAANWSNNSHKITSLANGSAAQDAAAFGQIPTSAASIGGVTSVAAGDTSIVVGGTATAPTVETGTLDVIAADHPPAANWSNNSHKITSLANGSAAQDAAAFGQIPAALPPNGSAGGDLGSTYPNPTVLATHLSSPLPLAQGGTAVNAGSDAALLTALGAAALAGATFTGVLTDSASLRWAAVRTVTGSVTLSASTDTVILANAATGNIVLTLPDATTCAGQLYVVKKTDSSGNTVATTPVLSQTIDGFSAFTIGAQLMGIFIISDGANWDIINAYGLTAFNTLDDGGGGTEFNGLMTLNDGTNTSTAIPSAGISFVSGTAKQIDTNQDMMLYIAVQTSAALAVAIGSTSSVTLALMPSKTYALGLISIRIPMGWWVKITGTIADLSINGVPC